MNIASKLIKKIISSPPKIAVIGDYIEDRYIFSKVDRISPEAPVLVARQTDYRINHGGAGHVWDILSNLGVDAYLFCDGDPASWTSYSGKVFVHPNFHSIKTRVISGQHHLLRIDEEPHSEEIMYETFASKSWSMDFIARISEFDAVVISDYGKGALGEDVIKTIITICQENNKPCIADTKSNFQYYWGCTVIKCNHKEAGKVDNIQLALDELEIRHWIVTHGEHGMDIYSRNQNGIIHVEGVPVSMVDVCGAGDTVTAILGVCAGYDYEIKVAAELANFMAAESCKHIGVYTITHEDLLKYDNRY